MLENRARNESDIPFKQQGLFEGTELDSRRSSTPPRTTLLGRARTEPKWWPAPIRHGKARSRKPFTPGDENPQSRVPLILLAMRMAFAMIVKVRFFAGNAGKQAPSAM